MKPKLIDTHEQNREAAHVWLKQTYFDWKNIHAISSASDKLSPISEREPGATGKFPTLRPRRFSRCTNLTPAFAGGLQYDFIYPN
jgi:hypothetical protein